MYMFYALVFCCTKKILNIKETTDVFLPGPVKAMLPELFIRKFSLLPGYDVVMVRRRRHGETITSSP